MITTRLQLLIALFALVIVPPAVFGQTDIKSKSAPVNQVAQTRAELIEATERYKSSAQEVVQFQEQEIAAATKKLEQLRQLVADGLIARNELVAGEEALATAKGKLESTLKGIAESDNLIAQVKEAEVAEKKLNCPNDSHPNGCIAKTTKANINALQRYGGLGPLEH